MSDSESFKRIKKLGIIKSFIYFFPAIELNCSKEPASPSLTKGYESEARDFNNGAIRVITTSKLRV